MKKLLLSLTFYPIINFANMLAAQGLPPNPPNNPNAGGGVAHWRRCSIGSGTLLLVSLAAVYGARKYHHQKGKNLKNNR